MSTDLLSLAPGDSARRALELLETGEIRHLLVMGDGALLGMVSNRDLLRVTALNAGRIFDLDGCTVGEIMTPAPLEETTPEADILEVARRMREQKIGALPVVQGGQTVGIVTTDDVLAAVLEGVTSA